MLHGDAVHYVTQIVTSQRLVLLDLSVLVVVVCKDLFTGGTSVVLVSS
jgi:hypothetical protein